METDQKTALLDVLKSKINRQLLYYLDLCARCAICRDACQKDPDRQRCDAQSEAPGQFRLLKRKDLIPPVPSMPLINPGCRGRLPPGVAFEFL